MERRLGLVLVDRTRRGSALTPSGRVACGWAQRVLSELDGLLTGAEALRTRRDAELRVAASMTIAEHLVPTWIGELRKSQPELSVAGDLAEGRLVAVAVTDLDLRRVFRAVWPVGRKVIGPAARLLTVAASYPRFWRPFLHERV